jgi:hypothetical protein
MGMNDFYCNLQPKESRGGKKGFGFFKFKEYYGTDCTCLLCIPCICRASLKESILDGAILRTLAW